MAGKAQLAGNAYEVVKTINDVSVSDSFVKWFKAGTGSGETRLYLGPQAGPVSSFFGVFPAPCFFLRDDLQAYLNAVKWEFKTPIISYSNRAPSERKWNDLASRVDTLPARCNFLVEEALGAADEQRYYIRSNDSVYTLFRECAIPRVTRLSIVKLIAPGESVFYFRPYVDFSSYSTVPSLHPAEISDLEAQVRQSGWKGETDREQVVLARCGQGRFRKELLTRYPACLVTGVTDQRLLTASHIKPWKESNNDERISIDNGLVLTPNVDRLFDRGLVSFSETGTALISPFLDPDVTNMLGLATGFSLTIRPNPAQVEFLNFHQGKVFQAG